MGAVMRLVSRLVSRCWMTALVLSAGLAAGDAQAALQGRAVPTNGDPIAIEIGEGQLLRLDRAMASVFIANPERSEEHTSELQSLMRNSYAVFCVKKKT